MRLAKNFGLSTFPVFRHCPTFDGRNKSGILTLVSNVRKFRETETETTEIFENFDICRKFQYLFDIFGIFDIWRYIYKKYTGIFENWRSNFRDFQHKPSILALKMVKMALNMVENYENYTEITGIFDSRHIFDVSTRVKNVPKYSSFDFRLSTFLV
jgi:hypothetical protein